MTAGIPPDPEVFLLAFDKPCDQTPLGLEPEYPILPSGGMYMARQGARTAAQIVMPRRLRSFEALRCDPVVRPQERSVQSVTRILYFTNIWRQAGLPGDPLSRSRQQTVLKAFAERCFVSSEESIGEQQKVRHRITRFTGLMTYLVRFPGNPPSKESVQMCLTGLSPFPRNPRCAN